MANKKKAEAKFKTDDLVRLKPEFDEDYARNCPEGRFNSPMAYISYISADGNVYLRDDIRGRSAYHSSELKKVDKHAHWR